MFKLPCTFGISLGDFKGLKLAIVVHVNGSLFRANLPTTGQLGGKLTLSIHVLELNTGHKLVPGQLVDVELLKLVGRQEGLRSLVTLKLLLGIV